MISRKMRREIAAEKDICILKSHFNVNLGRLKL